VAVKEINTALVGPMYNTITAFPRTVLDQANPKSAVACYKAADIPRFASTTSQDSTRAGLVFGTPLSLNQCDDVYMLSHAGPSPRPASYKKSLINLVNSGGWLCQACHSGYDLDVNVTHFLSTGLILYESHSNGTLPYNSKPM
jgi:hypothetical protein